MKKSNLILFALLPAFALTSCGLQSYAENYKLITDNLNKAKAKTDKYEDNIAFKRTFSSNLSMNSFITTTQAINEETAPSKSAKITEKISLKFKDAIYETTGETFHGNINLEFSTYLKNTADTSEETTTPENSETNDPKKANDQTKDEVNEEPTKPEGDSAKPGKEEVTPNDEPATPDGDETTPDEKPTTPDGGETTPEGGETTPEGGETTPEGDEATPDTNTQDIKKGIKTNGTFVLNTYLFTSNNEAYFTLDGNLKYTQGGSGDKTFKVFTKVDSSVSKDLINDYKEATSTFYNILPEPPKDNTNDNNSKSANEIVTGVENVLRYVSASSTDTETNVKYTHARTQKPLIPGNTDSTTSSLDINITDGLVTKANTQFEKSLIDLNSEIGKVNYQIKDKTSNTFIKIDKLDIPKLEEFKETDSVNALSCIQIFTFLSTGTNTLFSL